MEQQPRGWSSTPNSAQSDPVLPTRPKIEGLFLEKDFELYNIRFNYFRFHKFVTQIDRWGKIKMQKIDVPSVLS